MRDSSVCSKGFNKCLIVLKIVFIILIFRNPQATQPGEAGRLDADHCGGCESQPCVEAWLGDGGTRCFFDPSKSPDLLYTALDLR